MPALRAALEALRGPEATAAGRSVEKGGSFSLQVDGQTFELQPDEVILETSAPEGYAVAEDGPVLVALDTTLTPELKLEGAMRDLVRVIQDARKEAGLEISDRIKLYLNAQDGGAQALDRLAAEFGQTVQAETLATELTVGPAPEGAHRAQVELEAGVVEIGIEKR